MKTELNLGPTQLSHPQTIPKKDTLLQKKIKKKYHFPESTTLTGTFASCLKRTSGTATKKGMVTEPYIFKVSF